MQACEKCGRPLQAGEDRFCPACRSDRSHKIKKWAEGVGVFVVVVGLTVWRILSGGKGGGAA
jgi:RNA polymerase subunit RPABC4/transcription elongation factor Spt4